MPAFFRNLFAPPRHMILVVLALWGGLALAENRSERHGLAKDDLSNLVFYCVLAYILGGRIGFVLENLSIFSQSPLDIFSLSPNIFDVLYAGFVALLAGMIYLRRRGLPLWGTLDALTPVFALLAVGVALSHLAAETAYGKPTDLPWGIQMRNAVRHPSQIYESAASLLTFGLIWFRRPGPPPGILFLTFAALTAGWRLFLEAYRGDSTFILDGVRAAQVAAFAVLAISFLLYEHRLRGISK